MVRRTWSFDRDNKVGISTDSTHTSHGDDAKLGHGIDQTSKFCLSLWVCAVICRPLPIRYAACLRVDCIRGGGLLPTDQPRCYFYLFVPKKPILGPVGLIMFGLLRTEKLWSGVLVRAEDIIGF